jgi:hypothetical protein
VLNLADAYIANDGCDLVVQFLRDNPATTSVELRGNNIGPEGAAVLAQAFAGANTNVRSLSLEWNMIGNGIGPLAEAIALNPKLEVLDLRNNRIGPEGAEAIARLLETNKGLIKLDLRWNEIGSAGANALLAAFRVNRSLKQLDLAGNKIPEGLMAQLESAVRGEETATLQQSGSSPAMLESVVPIRLLDKEKSYADDLQNKYESQLIANSRSEARIAEIEGLLDNERRKTKDVR